MSSTPQVDDGARPCRDCDKPVAAHTRPCQFCGRDELHHGPEEYELELQARARFAVARRDAGLPLSELDAFALRAWGEDDLGRVTWPPPAA